MDCKEFLSRYTEYRDGLMSSEDVARAEVHLSGCGSCQRYRRVVDRGVRELRTVPGVTTDDDFQDRLRHRIYHLKDGDAVFGDGSRSSGASAVAAVGIAILLTAAAWTPVLRQAGNSVTLPPIVVNRPGGIGSGVGLQVPASAFFREGEPWRSRSAPRWSPPPTLWTSSESSSSSTGLGASSAASWASTGRTRSRILTTPGVSLSRSDADRIFFGAASSDFARGSESFRLDLD